MINGPVAGGVLIAASLVGAAMYAGSWFSSALEFSGQHRLDTARTTRPVVCSFNTDEFGGKTTGTVRVRDGLMRFSIHEEKAGEVPTTWGAEVDMNDSTRMMSQAADGEPFLSMDKYPDLRVQIIDNLNLIMRSEKLHCSPWWSHSSFVFALQRKAL